MLITFQSIQITEVNYMLSVFPELSTLDAHGQSQTEMKTPLCFMDIVLCFIIMFSFSLYCLVHTLQDVEFSFK